MDHYFLYTSYRIRSTSALLVHRAAALFPPPFLSLLLLSIPPSEAALNVLADDGPAPHPRLNGHLILQTQSPPRRRPPLAIGLGGPSTTADEAEQDVRHVADDDGPRVQGVLAGPLGGLPRGQHPTGMVANRLPTEIPCVSLTRRVVTLCVSIGYLCSKCS